MAHTIVEYIRRCGMNPGNHLTEQELVDEFQISRTPVRAALSYLAEQGVFERRKNRGFFLKLDKESLWNFSLELPKTVEDRLLSRIAEDWFAMRIPQSFSETDFRRRYGIGRSLATRVLFRLAEDGIISRNPGHGWRFESARRHLTTFHESYSFCLAVEPAAILSPGFELDRALAEQYRRRHESVFGSSREEPSLETLADLDGAFHRMIGVSSRNRFFLSAIERQNALRRIIDHVSKRQPAHMQSSCMDQLDILTAIELGKREEAAKLMRQHIVSAYGHGGRPQPEPTG
ncbi:MAG: GntR family transcriptional regulator [Rhodospirillaceae bacterium]|nr:GntR family transcriptional regulator [Rhodospirillaceae bacterium]